MGKSCQSALKLSGHLASTQQKGYTFGRHLALAWQARMDQISFQSYDPDMNFSLVSAPVLFHLQRNPEWYYRILEKSKNGVQNANYLDLYESICRGSAIERTEKLQEKHAGLALDVLDVFPECDAKEALKNIISAMPSPAKV